MRDQDLDILIGSAAAKSGADSFGPYFADRVVTQMRQPAPSGRRGWTWLRPALALSAVALLLLVGDRWRVRTEVAAVGQIHAVTLADGSEVTLAPGSTLSWRPFGSQRVVQLKGEAFFEVASEDRIFRVETFAASVVVTGTAFNVQAWPEAHRPEVLVSLEEGGVRVESRSSPPLDLTPGQTAIANGSRLALAQDRRLEDAVRWRSGGIALIDVPLGDALAELERRFARELSADPQLLSRPTTYVAARSTDLESALDAICFALGLAYRPVRDGFHIEPQSIP